MSPELLGVPEHEHIERVIHLEKQIKHLVAIFIQLPVRSLNIV